MIDISTQPELTLNKIIQTEPVQTEAAPAGAIPAVIQLAKTGPGQTERINGRDIRVGTLEQFVKEVLGRDLKKLPRLASGKYAGVSLGVDRFETSQGKFFRLIWTTENGTTWLSAEDNMDYCCKGNAEIAGYELGDELRVFFDDRSQATRPAVNNRRARRTQQVLFKRLLKKAKKQVARQVQAAQQAQAVQPAQATTR